MGGGGMKAHRWIGNTCNKCGLMRIRKVNKTKIATWEYSDGIKAMDKRPDCKTQQP